MTPDQFSQLFGLAQNEALAAFGNGAVYVEKYLEHPRHVEIQVMGDLHGKVVHMGERDCSVQRRHQKLIEESPSPALDDALRARMGQAAVALASNIGYTGAGTIEFLLDPDGNFYFMEMNTRIQVEHPVTEMVTSFDMVKEQIRVASGEPVSFQGDGRRLRGHAIECRINAEDPYRNFQPSPGLITAYHPPGGPGVRLDTHVYAGYTVPPYYDSLLAKVIVHGNTRRGGAQPDGAGAGQLHPRGRHHDDPLSRPGHPASGLRGGEDRHPVPRAGIPSASARDMRVDVFFTPAGLTPAEVQGCTVFVIDILRATTCMCAALSHGAKAIIPVGSTEEALRLAQTIGSADVLLAGEKNCVRIPGFHLGNSPLEMTEPGVRGKTIIVTTSNGTAGAPGMSGSRRCLPDCGGEPHGGGREGPRGAGGRSTHPHRVRRPRRGLLARRCVLRRPAGVRHLRRHQATAERSMTRVSPAWTWSAAMARGGSGRWPIAEPGES